MRDEQYCEVMLEAYRDILKEILEGQNIEHIHRYTLDQIKFHEDWRKQECMSITEDSCICKEDENNLNCEWCY